MGRRFIIAVVAVIVVVVIASILFSGNRGTTSGKLQVTASVYPFADFARQVGRDKIELRTVTSAGTEPHDFEPSPQDLVKLHKSKIFIYSGAGFEPWADKAIEGLHGVEIVKASKGIELLPAAKELGGEDGIGVYDPHFYLDPVYAQETVNTIAEALSKADPSDSDYYKANAADYKRQLAALDKEYSQGLSQCRNKDIITSHAAFAYLAKRYGLRQVPIAGLSEEEPSPARLAEIAAFAKQNNIKYIFVEKLVSPRLSETVANEVGAKLLVLNPIEGLTPEDRKVGKDYVTLMRDNLANLKIALGCKNKQSK